MSRMEAALQNLVDFGAQVLSGRHRIAKLIQAIQVGDPETLQDVAIHEHVQAGKIADHSAAGIHLTANGYLQSVVVPVTVGIVALAVNFLVLLRRKLIAVQAMRSREPVAPGEISLHSSP